MRILKQKRSLLFVGLTVLIVAAILVIVIGRMSANAQLVVEATPESHVYIDGEFVGTTPTVLETTKRSSTLKIIPVNNQSNHYLPYETALSLTPHTKTIVRRTFGETPDYSTTQILGFEKSATNEALVTIITNPPAAYVFFNNEYVGTTPLRVGKPQETYSVQVTKDGYAALHTSLKSERGYNLVAYIDLPTHTLEIPEPAQSFVTILDTPTGSLNVRKEPSVSSQEIARVSPGREYRLKGFSEDTKWIELFLNEVDTGWVLGQYATTSAKTTQTATTPP